MGEAAKTKTDKVNKAVAKAARDKVNKAAKLAATKNRRRRRQHQKKIAAAAAAAAERMHDYPGKQQQYHRKQGFTNNTMSTINRLSVSGGRFKCRYCCTKENLPLFK